MPAKPASPVEQPPVPEFLISRQPIFDRETILFGYELLDYAYWPVPPATRPSLEFTTQVLMNTLVSTGLESLSASKKVFVPANRHFLQHLPSPAWPPAKTVLEIEPAVVEDEAMLTALTNLTKQGYTVALDLVSGVPKDLGRLASVVTIVKVPVRGDQMLLTETVNQLKLHRVQLLAQDVHTQDDWAACRRLGFMYFQGYFICQPRALLWRRADASRFTVLRTLARIQNPDADFRSLGNIIAQDASLSHRLLALVNSPAFSVSRTINSLEQAVAFLGLNQLRAWLTVLTLASIPDKPPELTNLAMLRAKMCELLAPYVAQRKSDAFFVVGLFSVLDALFDLPMADVLTQLPLAPEIVEGLARYQGAPGQALKIVLIYERGDWEKLERAKLRLDVIGSAFRQAVQWTSELTRSLEE
jgi:c-di-GMP phosphodiesterase